MLKVIEDQAAINKYARQFVRRFKPFIDEQIKVKLGHQGASFPAKVSWSKKLGIWTFSHAVKNVRYWNAFGVDKPAAGELVSITAEINFPWAGIDRKTGGSFARDAWGNIFAIHRGKIGGGKKGVGKLLFEHNYRGVWSLMEDGRSLTQVAVIGSLTKARFALQTAQFVKKIELLKSSAVYSTQTQFNFPEISFHENLVGNLPQLDEPDVNAQCDRDLVISSLASLLRRWKLKIGNNENHEIFIMESSGNRISHVFEVVTDTRENCVLAAAAKMLLQLNDVGEKYVSLLALPEESINHFAQILGKIGIAVISFRLEDDRIIFPDLGKIKLDQNPQL